MTRTISAASASTSATTSRITVRTMRFLSRASVVEALQTDLRSSANVAIGIGAASRGGDAPLCDGYFRFDVRDAREGSVPPRLQFPGDQAIGRVGGVILPESPIGCVLCGFKVAHQGVADLIALPIGLGLSGGRRRNSARLDDMQQSRLDGVINPQAAEGDAASFAMIEPASGTTVARNIMLCAGVANCQLAPAAAAADKSRQKRIAMFGGAMMPARSEYSRSPCCGSPRLSPSRHSPHEARHQSQPLASVLAADSSPGAAEHHS